MKSVRQSGVRFHGLSVEDGERRHSRANLVRENPKRKYRIHLDIENILFAFIKGNIFAEFKRIPNRLLHL